MKPIFFYDTETSGLPLWNQPSDDARQPHIVQAAGLLVDRENRSIISSFNLISKPVGWTIPDDVAEIHGITTEYAKRVGVPEMQVLSAITGLCQVADLRVAHNESFDARIVRIGLKRMGWKDELEHWAEFVSECTASLSSPVLKLEATTAMKASGRGRQPKRPKLQEAYKHFFGHEFANAHTAMGDAVACTKVYFALQDRHVGEPTTPESEGAAPAAAGEADFLS